MTAELARELVEVEDLYDVEVVDLLAVENTVGHAGGTVMPVEELREALDEGGGRLTEEIVIGYLGDD